MFSNVFPRLFGQFREGQIVRGVFTFATAGTLYTATNTTFNSRGQTIKVTSTGTGLATVTFPKCRHVEVLSARVDSGTPGTFGNIREFEVPPMTDVIAVAGSFTIALYKDDGVSGIPALADPANGSTVTTVLYLGQ